ncbi:hypothetical protein [Streptomyces lasalocidi]|uniref:hypothetical protein n=1 Tax=Streptomyces lasalocidi TaxID=324833 RepID=UPI001F4FB789|nr:hypothetical protein [Streptomyces lasalocidi]
MTALTGERAVAAPPAAPRAWGTARTVLRLHRTALLVWAAVVAGLSGWLVWLTLVTAPTERAAIDCTGEDFCDSTVPGLGFSTPVGWIGMLVAYAFLAAAAFAGGALIGREVESGTARLAWTQSVTPTRWLAAKLAVPALVIAGGATVLVLVFRWSWDSDPHLMFEEWSGAAPFLARGPATVAYALCALAVGTLTALLLRRALPALGVSPAVMGLLNLALTRLRPSLWPQVHRTSAAEVVPPEHAWVLDSGALVHGRPRTGVPYWNCGGAPAAARRCLDDLGVTGYYASYHPQSHYWPLHLVETAVVLAVAALATAAAFTVVRRRTRRHQTRQHRTR